MRHRAGLFLACYVCLDMQDMPLHLLGGSRVYIYAPRSTSKAI